MDWISHFLQSVLAVFQSATALIVAITTLITGIAALIADRARWSSRRDKARRTNTKTLSNKTTEKAELVLPKSNDGVKIVASTQSTSSDRGSSDLRSDEHNSYAELPEEIKEPSEVDTISSKQEDPRRITAQSALKAVSGLTELSHNMAEQCRRSSKSGSPYKNQLILLDALAAALPDLRRLARTLDSSLNKLDITWDGEDPRDVFFRYIDPFTPFPTQRSIEGMRAAFIEEAERVAAGIEGLGYPVQKKKHRWNKHMPLSYVITESQGDKIKQGA